MFYFPDHSPPPKKNKPDVGEKEQGISHSDLDKGQCSMLATWPSGTNKTLTEFLMADNLGLQL